MIVEQISSGGTVTYLHHDQQGSTRLLTGSTGTVIGKCTYGAYGTPTCEGTTITPLGYDAQYTSTDTGLIYLRARTYDPKTAQFLSVDPLVGFMFLTSRARSFCRCQLGQGGSRSPLSGRLLIQMSTCSATLESRGSFSNMRRIAISICGLSVLAVMGGGRACKWRLC
jgi:RHS repeat-associated protein